jgi:hypothetical protein
MERNTERSGKYLVIIALVVLSCVAGTALAQSDIAGVTRQVKLLNLSHTLRERDVTEHAQAEAFARAAGIPMKRDLPGGGVLELQRIAPGIGPVFYITNNLDAADTVSTDELRPGGSAGLNLEGAGMTVAEWDGGAVYPDHTDFIGRLTQMDGASEVSGHSTHVAGTPMAWNHARAAWPMRPSSRPGTGFRIPLKWQPRRPADC